MDDRAVHVLVVRGAARKTVRDTYQRDQRVPKRGPDIVLLPNEHGVWLAHHV